MSLGRRFTNLSRLANMSVSVDSSSNKAAVSVPSFGVDDIDRTGSLTVWSLQRMLSAGRILAFHLPNPENGRSLLEYDKLTSDRFTFMASTRTEVAREFYHLTQEGKQPNLSINVHLGYMGTSSLNTVAMLEDLDTGKILGKNTNQVVSVDKATRKPTPLPDWWKEKYTSAVVENERLIIPSFKVPDNVHKYDMAVRWGDIDIYKHTNYVSYIRFCIDGAMQGVMDNAYVNLKEDILKYHVKKMELCYKGESKAGDILTITSWEPEADSCALNFDISRDNTTIFQSRFDFYTPDDM